LVAVGIAVYLAGVAAQSRRSPQAGRHARLLVSIYPSVDEAFDRLHRAGWSIGEAAGSAVWIVIATNDENMIKAEGRTQAEEWYRATLLAEALGSALTSTETKRRYDPGRGQDSNHEDKGGTARGVETACGQAERHRQAVCDPDQELHPLRKTSDWDTNDRSDPGSRVFGQKE
jgi:hypothetical protein